MLSILAAIALQAPVLVTTSYSGTDRIRFVFASNGRDGSSPGEPMASPVDSSPRAFKPRAYHDIVKRCGGKRLSAWQNGSRIVVSGISGESDAALAQCVADSANGLSRVVLRDGIAMPLPDNRDIQPLIQSPTRVR